MEINWQRFAEQIHSAANIVLTVHHRPDGDCIGSALAMQRILTQLGKNVLIISPHPVPPTLAFLDPQNIIRPLETLTDEDRKRFDSADTLLVLDTSSPQQLGGMAVLFQDSNAKKLVIDHHVINVQNNLGAEMFVDENAEATGTLVVRAAEALGVPLSQDIAEAVFTALATDTGWFRFSSVKAETFRTAGKLLDAGVRPDVLYRELYEQESLGRLRLAGRTLSKTESILDGRFLLSSILLEDFDAAGARSSDSEDIVNMLLSVKGTQMAALISELKDNTFKVSFRSRCKVDCSVLAKHFGGGGHREAAGASFSVPFAETKQAVIEAVVRELTTAF
ncbi:MAG: bifunctional oligoribonuclease/PAP phosphatase NrnA [Planctomycetaceae bacterium]|jgi:phosphoesterase RecJ-like protein|nr:bifunctional oligoribonuclease/PAP phosphatase NrnA [Planctomycetaceae bacterium]